MSLKTELEQLKAELASQRDELNVQMHLAKQELKSEWQHAEEKTEHFFTAVGELTQDAKEDLLIGMKKVGNELKETYQTIKSRLM